MKLTKEKWVAIDGSIYTGQAFKKTSLFNNLPMREKHRESVAFNVGQSLAEHIVKLHNASLENQSHKD